MCVSVGLCVPLREYVPVILPSGRWRSNPSGLPTHAFSPFRLKLNSKRNQLVRELEEATRQVAALHSQLKRCVVGHGLSASQGDPAQHPPCTRALWLVHALSTAGRRVV